MTELKWKTGKPPKDGWYWVTNGWNDQKWIYEYSVEENLFLEAGGEYRYEIGYFEKWAGPIPEPEE